MRLWFRIKSFIKVLLGRESFEADMSEEIRFHLEQRAEHLTRLGISEEDARRKARLEFGAIESKREECRQAVGLRLLDELRQDLRYSVRSLWRRPGLTLAALFTLALGIGATTTVYSVVHNVLLDPFPYRDSDRIIDLLISNLDRPEGGWRGRLLNEEFLEYQRQSQVFEDVLGTVVVRIVYRGQERNLASTVALVTPNLNKFLGVSPLIGRPFTEGDAAPDAPAVALLSFTIWTEHFGSDQSILNRTVDLGGRLYSIVGVMPPRFTWHNADFWVPSDLHYNSVPGDPGYRWFQAHLKPGVTNEQAETEVNTIARRIAEGFPEEYPENFKVEIIPVIDFVVRDFRGVLYTLLGAVGLLLFIACCNVASMLLARAASREWETAVRLSLGAGRWRIMRQLLVESFVLAVGGGILGCGLAWIAIQVLNRVIPLQNIPSESVIALNAFVLVFSLVLSVLTTLVFGLAPAYLGSWQSAVSALKIFGSTATAGFGRYRLLNVLVVIETALSIVLLVGGILLMGNFLQIVGTDIGVKAPENLILLRVRQPSDTGDLRSPDLHVVTELERRLAALPGVAGAAVLTGAGSVPVEIVGRHLAREQRVQLSFYGADAFAVQGTAVTKGRSFSPVEVKTARRLAVVNETFAQRYFGRTEEAIGQTCLLDLPTTGSESAAPRKEALEIIGTVKDFKNAEITQPVEPQIFLPYTLGEGSIRYLAARTEVPPPVVRREVNRVVHEVSADLVAQQSVVSELLSQNVYARPRFNLIVLGSFALVGLVLVAIGVYGVVSYTMAQKSQEIGIRMALGATPKRTISWVFRLGLSPVMLGVLVGLGGSLGIGRILESTFSISAPNHPSALLVAAAIVIVVAGAACSVPAVRIFSLAPTSVLRKQ